MKVDLVIHSSDANPFYLEFWPLVSKVWKLRFDVEPVLVFIGDETTVIDETYGRVIRMNPIPDIPVYLQCQWVRFWIPSQFPDKTCLLSDIDMFPISKEYFINQVKDIPDDKYVHLNPDHQFIPVCYHLARGSTFTRILSLDENWEHSMRSLYEKNLGHDCTNDAPDNPILKDKPNWGAEEEYVTHIIRKSTDQSVFVFLNRQHQRLDRSSWYWSPDQIQSDIFADAHSIRPYSEHRTDVDALVDELLNFK
jgi:hypothetical protein